MSAPDTNVKKQERRHKGPLVGMAWVVAFALLLGAAFGVWLFVNANDPGNDVPIGDEPAVESSPAVTVDDDTN